METQDRVIPAFVALLQRGDLSRTCVLIYGLLATLDEGDGVVITAKEIGDQAGIATPEGNRRTEVRRHIRSLKAAGLVRQTPGCDSRNASRYEVLGPKWHRPKESTCFCDTPAVLEDVSGLVT